MPRERFGERFVGMEIPRARLQKEFIDMEIPGFRKSSLTWKYCGKGFRKSGLKKGLVSYHQSGLPSGFPQYTRGSPVRTKRGLRSCWWLSGCWPDDSSTVGRPRSLSKHGDSPPLPALAGEAVADGECSPATDQKPG